MCCLSCHTFFLSVLKFSISLPFQIVQRYAMSSIPSWTNDTISTKPRDSNCGFTSKWLTPSQQGTHRSFSKNHRQKEKEQHNTGTPLRGLKTFFERCQLPCRGLRARKPSCHFPLFLPVYIFCGAELWPNPQLSQYPTLHAQFAICEVWCLTYRRDFHLQKR